MNTKSPIPVELLHSRSHAINNLDFEEADTISKQIQDIKTQSNVDYQNSITARIDEDNNLYSKYCDLKIESFALKKEMEARKLKAAYQEQARRLAEDSRREAQEFEKKWRIIFEQAVQDEENQVQTVKMSARILAKCDMYSSAISLRDSVKDVEKKGIKECLESFQRQYKFMIERQEQAFDNLHSLLKNFMLTMKMEEVYVKKGVETEKIMGETQQNVEFINTVLQQAPDDSTRKSMFDQYSSRITPTSNKKRNTKSRSSLRQSKI